MNDAFHHIDQNFAAPTQAELAKRQPDADRPQSGPERMPRLETSGDADDVVKMHFDSDDAWDVFIPDDDELDPQPEPGDFWIEPEE